MTPAQKPMRIPGKDIWEHFKSDESRTRCFPENEMLISSETYRPIEETFQQIKDTKAKNVYMTFDNLKQKVQVSGVSFRNSYPVPFGFLYKIDIFCERDQQVFDHFVTQVLDGLLSQDHIYKGLKIMLSVFFPYSVDKAAFLELCEKKLMLVPSSNPKVGCDVTVIEYGFGTDPIEMVESGWEGPKPDSKL
jgi:hypothetical protein